LAIGTFVIFFRLFILIALLSETLKTINVKKQIDFLNLVYQSIWNERTRGKTIVGTCSFNWTTWVGSHPR
jgi:hypothetical protein